MLNLPRWRLRVFFVLIYKIWSILRNDTFMKRRKSYHSFQASEWSSKIRIDHWWVTSRFSTVTAPCICFLGIKTSTKSPWRNSCKFISRSFIFELQDHVEVTVVLSVMISFLSVFSVKLHQDAVETLATLQRKSLFTGGKIHSLNQVKCSFSPILVLCIYVYTFFLAGEKLLRKI